ncbi:lytic transglycosylase domain-containing protein [Elioraea sp.]|uniref:lytic transglycosylase domain-containing protein n=1 Tax=Elioraea sp. TaxID=2185103 RepID=UPI0025BF6321|nr:lytic transglycosylase domain-containing protein [Elioraea sp.]
MNTLRTLSSALLALLAVAGDAAANPSARPAQDEDQSRLCRAAIRTAERTHGIPQALLSAIGRVESGRRDPASGNFGPWPWTINAEGRGQFFPTKAEAIATVRQLQAEGMRSIDVGCMQINLRHHPNAFANLDDAFDPAKNADYAARFLSSLQETSKNWLQAAANYHSHTPEFGTAYQRRVMAAWPDEQRIANDEFRQAQLAAWAARPAAHSGGPGRVLPNGGMGRMQQAALGRGLDAYRAAPIPPAFAPPAPARSATSQGVGGQGVTALRRSP